MPPDPDKRKLRELKRAVKKRGNKHRRQQLKRDLAANPEAAAETEATVGRHSSAGLNGLDRDATRKKEEDSPRRHGGHGEEAGDGQKPGF